MVQTGRPPTGDARASRPRTPQGQVNHFDHITLSTQDVRLTGLQENMHTGDFPSFMGGKMMVTFQIWSNLPVEKLRLMISCTFRLAFGPTALWKVGGKSPGHGAPLVFVNVLLLQRLQSHLLPQPESSAWLSAAGCIPFLLYCLQLSIPS